MNMPDISNPNSIKVSDKVILSPKFDSATTNYSGTINAAGININIAKRKTNNSSFIVNMNGSQLTINNKSHQNDLSYFDNSNFYIANPNIPTTTIQVIATAEDGITQKTYNISLTNTYVPTTQPTQTTQTTQAIQVPLSNDATLSNLKIYGWSKSWAGNGAMGFDKPFSSNIYNYTGGINFGPKDGYINVCATASQDKSIIQVKINGTNVQLSNDTYGPPGGNTATKIPQNSISGVQIIVTAPDGITKKTYYVNVNSQN